MEQYFEVAPDYEPDIQPLKPLNPKRKSPRTPHVILGETATVKRQRIAAAAPNSFETFSKELEALPIYMIIAHSCICPLGKSCYKDKPSPSFEIPPDTYLISFSQANDVFCASKALDTLIIESHRVLRNYLYLHDTDDLIQDSTVGTTRFSLFDGIMRAVSPYEPTDPPTEYPNIAYTFNDRDTEIAEENLSGVYRIDTITKFLGQKTLNNTKSIIKQNKTRQNFFLGDVIREVYEATGIPKGIFISTGCLPACPIVATDKDREDTMRYIGNLMNVANNHYRTLRPTWTRPEMISMGQAEKVPRDIPVNIPTTGIDPSELIAMKRDGLLNSKDIETILEHLPAMLADDADREEVKNSLRKSVSQPPNPLPSPEHP